MAHAVLQYGWSVNNHRRKGLGQSCIWWKPDSIWLVSFSSKVVEHQNLCFVLGASKSQSGWCYSSGFLKPWSPIVARVVCRGVWGSCDENQDLKIDKVSTEEKRNVKNEPHTLTVWLLSGSGVFSYTDLLLICCGEMWSFQFTSQSMLVLSHGHELWVLNKQFGPWGTWRWTQGSSSQQIKNTA